MASQVSNMAAGTQVPLGVHTREREVRSEAEPDSALGSRMQAAGFPRGILATVPDSASLQHLSPSVF